MFTLSAVAGGAAVFGVLGLVALVGFIRPVMGVIAAVLSIRAAWWHWRNGIRFRFDRFPVQARAATATHGWLGVAYFGWILGTSLATQMATPLLQALAALAAAVGPVFGIAVGVGLGLARSLAPWLGALTPGQSSPEQVVRRFAGRTPLFRIGGIITAVILICADTRLLI